MPFLKYVSILFLLLVAGSWCAKAQSLLPNAGSLFHTTIHVYGHTISGLTVFQTEGRDTLRVLFTTFAGPKLLDLRLTPNGYETLYAIKQLNRKMVLNTLYKDFAVLSGYFHHTCPSVDRPTNSNGCQQELQLSKKERLYYYYTSADSLSGAALFAKKKKMLTVEYTHSAGALSQIALIHHTFNMKLEMLKLNDDATGE